MKETQSLSKAYMSTQTVQRQSDENPYGAPAKPFSKLQTKHKSMQVLTFDDPVTPLQVFNRNVDGTTNSVGRAHNLKFKKHSFQVFQSNILPASLSSISSPQRSNKQFSVSNLFLGLRSDRQVSGHLFSQLVATPY